ncbi:PAS domain S-box protein [Zooshikella marina]|uniref:PAS domain S-box protein n=1 Tax=Zooshikella ganghwensis TaxID=202772 RepID=UPI001BAEFD46|nr:PAS domain S-box protein [Zooshikella ganghwensis]MBU2708925.1 PAS domain S-box protein [Zooshikella ganghwensis]
MVYDKPHTEQVKKQNEQENTLFNNPTYLRAILNVIGDGIITINRNGAIKDVNTIGEHLFGYLPGELIGAQLSLLIPEFSSLTSCQSTNSFEGVDELNTTHEIRGYCKDGSLIKIDISASKIELNNDCYFIILLRDTISKKKLQAKINRSEKIKSMVTDACLDAMVTVDMDGYVQEYNSAAEKIFGWQREEITGQLMENYFIPEEMREAHRKGIQRFKEEGKGPLIGKRIEIEAINKDGKRFPVELALVGTEIDGERLATAFVRDISDRKQAEGELIAARDTAQEASQAKSRFLSHMSHEIRSPLNAVLCSVNLIAERLNDPSHLRLLQTAKTSGQALLAVINEVLDFSKIEAGHLSIISDKTNLFTLLEDVLNSAQARLESSEVELLYFVDFTIKQITTDPVRFRQILNVLVDNAIKFTKQGVVSVTVLPVTFNSGKTALKVSVFDTGVGIPNKYLPNVFNEFEQVDASIDSRYGGTGLGLTIARKLVQLLNGNIYVASESQKGSCFTFIIPVTIEYSNIDPNNHFSSKNLIFISPNKALRSKVIKQVKQINNTCSSFSSLEALQESIIENDISLDNSILIIDEQTPHVPYKDSQQVIDYSWLPSNKDHCFCICADWTKLNPPFSSFKRIPKPFSLNSIYQNITTVKDETESRLETFNPTNGGQLLLVEDVAANRLVAGEMLRSRGFNVKTANDGEEAIQIAKREVFDVILMDIRMPKMNGYEATKALRESNNLNSGTPIIALTANAEKSEIQKCLNLGMNDFVSKPFDVNQLLEAIKRCRLNSSQNKATITTDTDPKWEKENNEPFLKQVILNQLVKDTSQESLTPLLNMFITELDSRFEAINLAVGIKDFDAIREEAHALKSCSGTFGASKLQRLTMQLEYAAKDYDTSLVDTLVDQFQSVLLATRKSYQEYLNKNC